MSKEQSSYDRIIIGTSPLAITEAVFQKKQGNSVLNIDNRQEVGGAWTTIKHQGIPEVEIGCHIWEVEKNATSFLKKFFNLTLISLKPSPRLYKNGLAIPYDLKMNISTSKYLLSKIARLKFNEIGPGLRTPANRFVLVPNKYLYPRGGAKELYNQLKHKIDQENVNTLLDTTIESIVINTNGCTISMENNSNRIKTNQLILTSLSNIKCIDFEDGSHIIPETKQVEYIHLHILATGSIPKRFSYHRIMDDDMIHRISDMSFQVVEEINADQVLLCVGIHSQKYHSATQADLLTGIINKLKARNLLSSEAVIDAHGFNIFSSYYTNPDLLTEIAHRSNGKLAVLRSTSFTYAFHNRLKDYQSLIS